MKIFKSFRFLVGALALPLAAFSATTLDVKVDTTQTRAPISPYVYGQFIEHLGRCVYGGIWAEMLEDRKFYFPITAEYAPYRSLRDTAFPVVGASPWEIVGEADAVTMVKEGAFVGEHSPSIREGAGIRQHDLALVKGKRYTGYVWARPLGDAAELEIALVWGTPPKMRSATRITIPGGEFARRPIEFTADVSSEHASLEILAVHGDVVLGPPSLMPADHVQGMRPDTLALLKQLNGTVYRWPGGNFVSGYNWRDGIGDRDRRPPRKNPAWTGVEHNDFGTDEFIAFCRAIRTEPMIAANTGFGDAYSAAQWVEYCNAATNTIGGGWRAKQGHEQPYGVKYWCVGNEMFGPWQLGYMQLHHYTLKHNEVAAAMWQVDPSLQLSGVGDLDTVPTAIDPDRPAPRVSWSQGMLEQCADHMTLLSEHFYRGRLPWTKEGRADLVTHVGMLKESIRKKADGHRKLQASLPNLHGRIVPIAMDEWNYWHRDYVFGELGCIYDLADGLGVAEGLHEYYRQSDLIHMAHYAQTVNVIGAIKTTKTAAEMETTGLVLQMYRTHFGTKPVSLGELPAPFDAAAALTADGRALTVSVVNPTKEELMVRVALTGATIAGPGERWAVAGSDELAHNTPGRPRVVDIQHVETASPSELQVPALSATVFVLPLK